MGGRQDLCLDCECDLAPWLYIRCPRISTHSCIFLGVTCRIEKHCQHLCFIKVVLCHLVVVPLNKLLVFIIIHRYMLSKIQVTGTSSWLHGDSAQRCISKCNRDITIQLEIQSQVKLLQKNGCHRLVAW
jgi:hypothetical protein